MPTTVKASLTIGQSCFVIWDDAIVEAVVSGIVISKPEKFKMLAELESLEAQSDYEPYYDPSLVVRYTVSPKSDEIHAGWREFSCADDMTLIQERIAAASMNLGGFARPSELLYSSPAKAANAMLWHCQGRPFVSFSSFRIENEGVSN